jgi:hypothetical protein
MGDPTQASRWADSERTQAPSTDPVLVVISPGELHGQTLVLDGLERTVGREAGNDLRLQDPYISRQHAVLRRAGSAVLVEDAGSTAGVYLNGQHIDGPALLRPGDVIRLGRTDLQLQAGGGAAAAGHQPPGSAGARFEVGAQRAEVISNVARDQISYNQYALKFAPLRRRARTLIQVGVALVLGCFVIGLFAMKRGEVPLTMP